MLEKAAALNRFEYSPFSKELKPQTGVAKDQYKLYKGQIDNAINKKDEKDDKIEEEDKREEDERDIVKKFDIILKDTRAMERLQTRWLLKHVVIISLHPLKLTKSKRQRSKKIMILTKYLLFLKKHILELLPWLIEKMKC